MPTNNKVRIKRATRDELWAVFEKYASVRENGELFMTDEDFAVKYLRLFPDFVYNRASLDVLCGVVDSNKDNRIDFKEFCAFEHRLCLPDALYRVLFNIFDYAGNGSICINEFVKVMAETRFSDNISQYMEVEKSFIANYFGKDGTKKIEYSDCCQFFHDFHESQASYSFKILDKNKNGFISHEDFRLMMLNHKNHLMTDKVRKKLDLFRDGRGGDISYAYFKAFQLLLSNMETVKLVYLDASGGSRKAEVAKKDFLYSAQMISKITPMEVDVLYSLCDSTGKTINFTELQEITPEHYMRQVTKRIVDIKLVENPEDRTGYIELLEVIYRLAMGTIAGSLGISPVYPSDLVKTRIINQRSRNVVYEGFFDCLRKTVRREGVRGLYRGLPLVLVFVPAEKEMSKNNHTVYGFVCSLVIQYEMWELNYNKF